MGRVPRLPRQTTWPRERAAMRKARRRRRTFGAKKSGAVGWRRGRRKWPWRRQLWRTTPPCCCVWWSAGAASWRDVKSWWFFPPGRLKIKLKKKPKNNIFYTLFKIHHSPGTSPAPSHCPQCTCTWCDRESRRWGPWSWGAGSVDPPPGASRRRPLRSERRTHVSIRAPWFRRVCVVKRCLYLQHAPCPLLLETLQKRPHQVIDVQQLELCLNDGLQRLWQESTKGNNGEKCCQRWNDRGKKAEEDFLTLELATAVRWMSGATPHVLMLARSCSSSHCSSGGKLWSPARRRDNPPTRSLRSAQGSWSPTRCGRGERSSMAPERKIDICHEREKNNPNLYSGAPWMMCFALQEVLLSPDQWHSSTLWCFLWEPEVGFKAQEGRQNLTRTYLVITESQPKQLLGLSRQIAFCTFSTQHSAERCRHLFRAQPEPSAQRRWRAEHGLQGLETHWTSSHSWGTDLGTSQPWVRVS